MYEGEAALLRIAICDDSTQEIDAIKRSILRLREYTFEYDVFTDPTDLLSVVEKTESHYDIFILDVEMPQMDGIELARQIRKKDPFTLFVFLTSHEKYMMPAFDVITFDFIVKPITDERLEQLIKKAVEHLKKTKRHLVLSFRKNYFSVAYHQILYIEKRGRQALVHTKEQIHQVNMTLQELWEQLDEEAFVNINVSFIINLKHLVSAGNGEAKLTNGECLHITKGYRKGLQEKHLEYVKSGM